ncbi:Glutathione S-transferase [Azotobacter vinelandii CA]|uniref:Glutathione S-transferase, N-terminal:Glutathione S-transferase, C-terminal n=3 Tax=Azotobacter group TaxID=351 RepID=C1DMI4_AZOVD|nr:Glutathione S-transferase, N-terminal:Glutathione S-transferase, C-terminal [Azotobacter vinelandii DJ]AGK14118.1 Glutathione S-transferase [Azotobacter vinelandii CA]AGK22434.1 Glutathione S-transferase [Azotobacter vinelandii CA6]
MGFSPCDGTLAGSLPKARLMFLNIRSWPSPCEFPTIRERPMKPHILGPDFSTFARSVRLYCEEKTLEYTHGLQVDGSSIARHSAEHLALHPFGKVPVLLHGERQVFETTSICRYLDAAFPQSSLQPHDLAQRTEVDQWSAALALYVDDRLIRRYLLLIASPIPPARPVDPEALATAAPAAIQTLDLLARQLGDRAFFCGTRYSMADALLTPMLDYLQQLPDAAAWLEQRQNLRDYLQHMRLRPSGRTVLGPPDRDRGSA